MSQQEWVSVPGCAMTNSAVMSWQTACIPLIVMCASPLTIRPRSLPNDPPRSPERLHTPACGISSASTVLPGSEELMGWIIGDHGFAMVLSPQVPNRIAANLIP